jgi:hypothetical protein
MARWTASEPMVETVVRGLTVTLCPCEVEWARRAGERMAARGQAQKLTPSFDATPEALRRAHVVGAQSELACAWATGKRWDGRDRWGGADIEGTNWEVRWKSAGARGWKTYQKDVDRGKVVVCMAGAVPTFTLVGWAWPRRVMADRGLRHEEPDGRAYWLFGVGAIERYGALGAPPEDYMREGR